MMPELNDYLEAMKSVAGGLKKTVSNLDEEAMNWLPEGLANTVAGLVRHGSAAAIWVLGDRVLGQPGIPHPGIDNAPTPKAELLRAIDDAVAFYEAHVGEVTAATLTEERAFGSSRRNGRQLLLMSLRHLAHHTGQVALLARLWTARHPAAKTA